MTRLIFVAMFLLMVGCKGECLRHSDCPSDQLCRAGDCVDKVPKIDSGLCDGGDCGIATDTGTETGSSTETATDDLPDASVDGGPEDGGTIGDDDAGTDDDSGTDTSSGQDEIDAGMDASA